MRVLLVLIGAAWVPLARGGEGYSFETDVPGVQEAMLSPDYWIQRLPEQPLRMSSSEVKAFNRRAMTVDPNMHDLAILPAAMTRAEVEALVLKVSRPASSPRYHAASGALVTEADYSRWLSAANLDSLAEDNPLRWGLVVERAPLRSYPTGDRILKQPQDKHLDRFQETAVFPGERVAVVHQSRDGQWYFVLNYHYGAWMPRASVALGSRQAIDAWTADQPRLVVTGKRAHTNFNPEDARSSELALDMGVSLPLVDPESTGFVVNGQNPYASYIVELPLRTDSGELVFGHALLARSEDVRVGHLPYRGDLLLDQAFKFLGERYGWGHDYNARDCTGFIGEVYKSFGLLMPRNTSQQAVGDYAPTLSFGPGEREAAQRALQTLQPGDLIYVPGHVVMYLGEVAGEPYVIHDRTLLQYRTETGDVYTGTLSGVSVTPLSPLLEESGESFLDSIQAIKRIALDATW